jgi:threonine/homoserine/homoserine lactone efflux protein
MGEPQGVVHGDLRADEFRPRRWRLELARVLVALVFAAVNLPSVTVWAWGGTQISRWLRAPGRLRAFNITMALLLVASLWPLVEPVLRPSG